MARIFTGAKARIKIKNDIIGFASGVNVNQENTLTDADIMGQLEVGDLAETAHKVNFSVNLFKLVPTDPDVAKNVAASIGIDTATTVITAGITSGDISPMRNQEYFDMEIFDESDNTVYLCQDCKFEGGSGTLDARGVWQGTWNFRCRKGFGL